MRIDGIGHETFHGATEVAIDPVQQDGFNYGSFQGPVALSNGFVVSLSRFSRLPLLVGPGDLRCVLRLGRGIGSESCGWSRGREGPLNVEGGKGSRQCA